ncbi:MAG TPA: hypothetical protein VGF17_13105, partial [Phytomonospora sp.]
LGVAPVIGPRPELAVAHGAVHLASPTPRPTLAYREVAAGPPAATPIPATGTSRSPARLRRLSIPMGIVAVLAVAFAVVMSALSPPEDADADAILTQAERAAVALLSYDYRDFDASKRNGLAYATGTFAEDYGRNMDERRDGSIAGKAIVTASVSAKGLVSAGPEEATVLVVVDQTRRTPDVSGEKTDANRVELTMVPADGTWKVSAVRAL